MIEYYLGEVPILANVETYRLEDPEVCEWALARLDELVFKPVDGSGGKGIVIGPAATEAALSDLRLKVLADPRGWIAQEPVALSTAPTFVDGRMGAAPPRPAPVRGERRPRRVGRAGRARPASRCPRRSLVVNSSQGGGSKDTWVLAAADARARSVTAAAAHGAAAGDAVVARPRSARCPSRTPSSSSSSEQWSAPC